MIEKPKTRRKSQMSVNPAIEEHHGDPILIDFGRKSRKNVKRLRDGEGKLMAEVQDTIDELKANGTISQNAQPVIIIVREKESRKLGPLWPLT
jgi:hypothetical protein